MKKFFVGLLAVLLVAVMALSLVACSNDAGGSGETTFVSAYKSKGEWTELADPLSWEDLNAFPVKSADMSIEELRKLCVDFFRYTKTALWIPDDNFSYWHNNENTNALNQSAGQVYGGLPYIYVASGSIYRILDFMDPETGVVDIKSATLYPKTFGNQCAQGAYQGWSRVINSAEYEGTPAMTKLHKFYPVGDYTYESMDIIPKWTGEYGTDEVVKGQLGDQELYEAYAKMQHGDGIVYYTSAGHVVMIATDPVVVRHADGTIDQGQSYVTVIDQTPTYETYTTADGQAYQCERNVDAKWTFSYMREHNYLPFTFAEFLGTDPIEDTEIKFSHEGETITLEQLTDADLTCNYHIYDMYAEVYDKWGSQVLKLANRCKWASYYKASLSLKASEYNTVWGDPDSLKAGGDYTVKVYAQLGTGERPTLWEGKLIVE